MSPVRCAVLAGFGDVLLTQSAFESLSRLAGQFEVSLRHVLDARECFDVIVVSATSDDFDRAEREIAALRARCSSSAILALCERLSQAQTLELLRAGVSDFAAAPYSTEELCARVQRLAGHVGAQPSDAADSRVANLVGSHPSFARQVAMLPPIASCDIGVLILGETGTGKELCAQAIHYLSPRASRPWVAVNCGAIPTELVESELFGHVRGAFTSAHAARTGLVREAEGGTLFLDEIDSLPLGSQSKLLRFLQEKEYRPVGSNQVLRADVRVIAACNRNLVDLIARGLFRQDLYFRLNVLNITLPPLRERREDIARLALHFIGQFARGAGRPAPGLAPQALAKLLGHDWPGNVRELKHCIERAMVLGGTAVLGAGDFDLPDAACEVGANDSFRSAKARMVEKFERGYIERLLLASQGNVTQAAQVARKNRRAFFELMRKHRIEPGQYRAGA